MTTELKLKLESLKGEEVFLRQVSKYKRLVKADYGKIKDLELEIYHPSIGTVSIELEDGLVKDKDMIEFINSVDLIVYFSNVVRVMMACGLNMKPKYNLLDYKSTLLINDAYLHEKVDAKRITAEYYYKEFKSIKNDKYNKDSEELNNVGVFIQISKYLNFEDFDEEKIDSIAKYKYNSLLLKKSQFKYVYNVDPDNKCEVLEFLRREIGDSNFDFNRTNHLIHLADRYKHLKNFVNRLVDIRKLRYSLDTLSNLGISGSYSRYDKIIVRNISNDNEISLLPCVRTNPSKNYYLMFDYKTYGDRMFHFINTGEDLSEDFIKSITEKFMNNHTLLNFSIVNTAITIKEYELDGEEIKDYFFKGLEEHKEKIIEISKLLPYTKSIKELKLQEFMYKGLDRLYKSLKGFEITIVNNYKNRLILKVSNRLNPYEVIKNVYEIFNTKQEYGIEFFNGCSIGNDLMELKMNYNNYSKYGISKLNYDFACNMLEKSGEIEMKRIATQVMKDLSEN